MHGQDDIRVKDLQLIDCVANIIRRSRTQMKSADHSMKLGHTGNMHGRLDRVDEADMTTRGDDHKTLVADNIASSMFIRVLILHQRTLPLCIGEMVIALFHHGAAGHTFKALALDIATCEDMTKREGL